MSIIDKIKTKAKELFSIPYKNIERHNKYSGAKYGIIQTKRGMDLNTNNIEFSLARHILDEKTLRALESLQKNDKSTDPSTLKKNIGLTSEIQSKLDNPQNFKTQESINKLITETTNELNIEGSDETRKLYALSKIAEYMGAELQVNFAEGQGYRHEMVIYIDENDPNPEKTIKTIMTGLGVNNQDYIQNTINRFNNREKLSTQTPEKVTQQTTLRPDPTPNATDQGRNKGIQV